MRLQAPRPPDPANPKELRTLGDHLRKCRLDLGLLQREVAARLGVDVFTVCNWEKGHTAPHLRLFPAIVTFLGYDPAPLAEAESLGARLALRRRTLGLSRRRLAVLVGLDPATIARCEARGTVRSRRCRAAIEAFLDAAGHLPKA